MPHDIRGYSQTTWTRRHTYMVGEMSTKVNEGYIHGQPSVNVDIISMYFVLVKYEIEIKLLQKLWQYWDSYIQ